MVKYTKVDSNPKTGISEHKQAKTATTGEFSASLRAGAATFAKKELRRLKEGKTRTGGIALALHTRSHFKSEPLDNFRTLDIDYLFLPIGIFAGTLRLAINPDTLPSGVNCL